MGLISYSERRVEDRVDRCISALDFENPEADRETLPERIVPTPPGGIRPPRPAAVPSSRTLASSTSLAVVGNVDVRISLGGLSRKYITGSSDPAVSSIFRSPLQDELAGTKCAANRTWRVWFLVGCSAEKMAVGNARTRMAQLAPRAASLRLMTTHHQRSCRRHGRPVFRFL